MPDKEPIDQNGNIEEESSQGEEETKVPEYEDLVKLEPERPVDLSKLPPSKSISEEEESTEQVSDLKTAMRHLLPRFKNRRVDEFMQTAMMSRISPDNYMDKLYGTAAYIMEEQMLDGDYDPIGIIMGTQDGLMIGFNGMGRVEISDVAGVAQEAELEKVSRELGL